MTFTKRFSILLAFAGALSFTVAGCDDEKKKVVVVDDDGGDEQDGSDNGDAGGGGGECVETDLGSGGACANADDEAAIGAYNCEVETYSYDAETNLSVATVAARCATAEALTGGDFKAKVVDCMLENMDDAISEDCGGCYAVSAQCAKDNCLAPCLTKGSSHPDCIECRCDAGCYKDFADCSGRTDQAEADYCAPFN